MGFSEDVTSHIMESLNNRIRDVESDFRRAIATRTEAAIEGAESSVDAALIQRIPSEFGPDADTQRKQRFSQASVAYNVAASEMVSLTRQLDHLHAVKVEYERLL